MFGQCGRDLGLEIGEFGDAGHVEKVGKEANVLTGQRVHYKTNNAHVIKCFDCFCFCFSCFLTE